MQGCPLASGGLYGSQPARREKSEGGRGYRPGAPCFGVAGPFQGHHPTGPSLASFYLRVFFSFVNSRFLSSHRCDLLESLAHAAIVVGDGQPHAALFSSHVGSPVRVGHQSREAA